MVYPARELDEGIPLHEFLGISESAVSHAVKFINGGGTPEKDGTLAFVVESHDQYYDRKERVYRIICKNVRGAKDNALLYKGKPNTGIRIEGIEVVHEDDGDTFQPLDPIENVPIDPENTLKEPVGKAAKRVPHQDGIYTAKMIKIAVISSDQGRFSQLMDKWKSLV